ncbi:MAG: hypothetical protein GEU88_01205 [Solirubrobacterales bacterium]|nr:hypothetical protein [Solirubrobacterales bacterium]
MSENAGIVRELIGTFPEDFIATRADPAARARATAVLSEAAHPDFETAMIAADGWTMERNGIDGFVGAFDEWTVGFERFGLQFEELIDGGEVVVVLVRQRGMPRGGAAEIVTESAGAFFFRDSRIERVEFHLDRAWALDAAGLEA